MSEIIVKSTRCRSEEDLQAITIYLKDQPDAPPPETAARDVAVLLDTWMPAPSS